MMYNNIFSIFLIIFILFESVFYLKHYFHFLRRFIFLYIVIFCIYSQSDALLMVKVKKELGTQLLSQESFLKGV